MLAYIAIVIFILAVAVIVQDVTMTYHDNIAERNKMLKVVKWAKDNSHMDAEVRAALM